MAKNILNIVLTGGPCAGKTTALEQIKEHLSQKGWTVLIVPETATTLINGGIIPSQIGEQNYQDIAFPYTMAKEAAFRRAAEAIDGNVAILYDRGLTDQLAYMAPKEKNQLLDKLGMTHEDTYEPYDAIIHLKTAAYGAEEFYTLSNNQARYESIEDARTADDRCRNAYLGHKNLFIVKNNGAFDDKMKDVLDIITRICDDTLTKNKQNGTQTERKTEMPNTDRPTEIERKFLAEMPDKDWFSQQPGHTKKHIIQTYINDGQPGETRVRQIDQNETTSFVKTHKEGEGLTRIEEESTISEKEAKELLQNADPTRTPIEKTRHVIPSGSHKIELDVYPWDEKNCVFEIELKSEDEEYKIPDVLKPIAEVTEFPEFKNGALAKNIPENGLADLYKTLVTPEPETKAKDVAVSDLFPMGVPTSTPNDLFPLGSKPEPKDNEPSKPTNFDITN